MKFALKVAPKDGYSLYYENGDIPLPKPSVGDKLSIPGLGTWKVIEVHTYLPSMGAYTPTWWVEVTVVWAEYNDRLPPVYNEDRGWVFEG